VSVTVGQKVLFHPMNGVIHHSLPHGVTLTGTVAHVTDDGRLNLSVLDVTGASHAMQYVPLIQKGEAPPDHGYYAEIT